MFPETVTITTKSASARTYVRLRRQFLLLSASAPQEAVVLPSAQSKPAFDLSDQATARTHPAERGQALSEGYQTMLASEAVLRRDWDTPEEDAAWASM